MTALPFERAERRTPVALSRRSVRRRIVAILPRGEAIRNFVHSGALDLIARRADVALLTVMPTEEYRRRFQRQYDSVHELHHTAERWIIRFEREILDMAHGRWLWSQAAQERWRRRDTEATTVGSKLKRLGKKLLVYPLANQPGLQMLSTAERQSSRWFRTSDDYVKLFRELNPVLVFNGSHVHSTNAIQAVQAAQWLGIPTAAFVFSWDNLTSQGRILPTYDNYLVWNQKIGDRLVELYPGTRPEQIFVTGTPQFDLHFRPEFKWTREEFCRRVGADPSRPIVLYSTGMANHMPGEPNIVEGIAAMLREMTDLGRPQLMVRVYPKDQTGRFEPLKSRCPDVLFPKIPWDAAWLTPALEDGYLLANMLRYSALGINVASTVSLELLMFGKPVINVGYQPQGVDPSVVEYARYYEFDHYRPVVESGGVLVARSASDMPGMIRQALVNPRESVESGRKVLADMFGSTLDGCCSQRVADTLLNLAARSAELPAREQGA